MASLAQGDTALPACWLSHTSVAVWISLALVGAPSSCGLSDLTGPLARSKDGRILKHFCYQPKGCHSATSGGSALPPSANPSVIPCQGGELTTKPGNTGQQSRFQKDLTSVFFAIDIFTFQTLKCCKRLLSQNSSQTQRKEPVALSSLFLSSPDDQRNQKAWRSLW